MNVVILKQGINPRSPVGYKCRVGAKSADKYSGVFPIFLQVKFSSWHDGDNNTIPHRAPSPLTITTQMMKNPRFHQFNPSKTRIFSKTRSFQNTVIFKNTRFKNT